MSPLTVTRHSLLSCYISIGTGSFNIGEQPKTGLLGSRNVQLRLQTAFCEQTLLEKYCIATKMRLLFEIQFQRCRTSRVMSTCTSFIFGSHWFPEGHFGTILMFPRSIVTAYCMWYPPYFSYCVVTSRTNLRGPLVIYGLSMAFGMECP